jgi:hypothetical protein
MSRLLDIAKAALVETEALSAGGQKPEPVTQIPTVIPAPERRAESELPPIAEREFIQRFDAAVERVEDSQVCIEVAPPAVSGVQRLALLDKRTRRGDLRWLSPARKPRPCQAMVLATRRRVQENPMSTPGPVPAFDANFVETSRKIARGCQDGLTGLS